MRIVCLSVLVCLTLTVAVVARDGGVDDLISRANSKGEFSGTVLVEKDGKVVYKRVVGLANRQFAIPNAVGTKFRICSITKQFTAVLVMQLVDSGKIDLDKTVSDYLPDFNSDTGRKIKIRDLLLSASGLPTLPEDFYVSEDPKTAVAAFAIGKYLQGGLIFQPGERFKYNNGDFIILGEIVEKLLGKPYETVLREKILEPLGMRNTGVLKNEDVMSGLASGYSYRDGRYSNESFVQIQNFGAAGAMYSTAGDLQLWNRALMSNKILSKRSTEEMFTPSSKLGFVGLGSWAYDLKFANGKTVRAVERQGYINGFCALNIIFPQEKISAVFLSNVETTTLFQTYANRGLSYDVLNELFGKAK